MAEFRGGMVAVAKQVVAVAKQILAFIKRTVVVQERISRQPALILITRGNTDCIRIITITVAAAVMVGRYSYELAELLWRIRNSK